MAHAKYRISLTDDGRRKYENNDFRLVVDPIGKQAFFLLYPDVSLTNPEIAERLGITILRASEITSSYCRDGYMKKKSIIEVFP